MTLRPRDAIELELSDLWAQTLELPSVARDDNFFSLGGTSFSVVRLWLKMQERFGFEAPMAALLQCANLSAMADLVRAGPVSSDYRCMVPIRSEGARLPLFCFHPLPGTVIRYAPLVAAMPTDQPVYAFQSQGLDPRFEPHRSVREMASAYLEEMLAIEAEGPFLLLGYSSGGTIAYEVARQLRARGADIAMLALIDTSLTVDEAYGGVDYVLPLLMENRLGLSIDPSTILALGADERINILLRLGKEVGSIPASYSPDHLRRMLDMYVVNTRATNDYVVEPSSERVVLFRSDESGEPALGWPDLVEHVTVIKLAGDHYDVMEPGRAELIAQHLTELCQRASSERVA